MESRLTLHYAPDNASLIVRLALEELDLPYQTALVDRATQAQKSPQYLQINPAGLIPALETPDGVIFETAAILLWLADRAAKLAPSPLSADRAPFLKWLFYTSNTLHTNLRMSFYPDQYVGDAPDAQKALRQGARGNILHALRLLDDVAAQSPAWFNGETISVLDIYVITTIRWMALYPVNDTAWFDLSAFPALCALCQRIETRNSVKAAQTAEGLGPTPFTSPRLPNPPEGSAL